MDNQNKQLEEILKRLDRAVGAFEAELWNSEDVIDELKEILKANKDNKK